MGSYEASRLFFYYTDSKEIILTVYHTKKYVVYNTPTYQYLYYLTYAFSNEFSKVVFYNNGYKEIIYYLIGFFTTYQIYLITNYTPYHML